MIVKFVKGEIYFRFFLPNIEEGYKSINQFQNVVNQKISDVVSIKHERALILSFSNGFSILFLGFGRQSDVVMYNSDFSVINTFRYKNRYTTAVIQNITIPNPAIDKKDELNIETLVHHSPEMKSELSKRNGASDLIIGHDAITDFEKFLTSCDLFLSVATDPPVLSYFSGENKFKLESGLKGLDFFASKVIARAHFIDLKSDLISEVQKDLRHYRKLVKDHESRIGEIAERRSYKELGDIIMTYSHSIKPGLSSAELQDYYTGQKVRIKLNPNLSAVENAEKYYRKSKNEVLELQNLQRNLAIALSNIKKLEEQLHLIETATITKEFKKIKKDKPEQKKSKPYKEVSYMDYIIYVGKNAKSNDELLKSASKNDIWMHARDVGGSHVIVKRKGKNIPDKVMQFAANLAAKNSKAKNQKIVPVVFTERKYVSKAKQSKPGEVKVLKEQLMDAYTDE